MRSIRALLQELRALQKLLISILESLPKLPDDETTINDLLSDVNEAIDFLETADDEDGPIVCEECKPGYILFSLLPGITAEGITGNELDKILGAAHEAEANVLSVAECGCEKSHC